MRAESETVRTEIPRHRTWNGPLIMPANHRATPGNLVCNKCGRAWKGKCPCVYYKRCTTFIDVIQNEFALKAWDRRLVAYGMGQRPDLVLAAVTCKPPAMGEVELTREDKDQLQAVADQAKLFAKGSAAASVGTSLHKLTQLMDEGQTLGYVPGPWPADIRAYEEERDRQGVEYVDIESFRVHDDFKVAGTTDRIGWIRGRLRVLDVKTGSIWWEGGPAMQMAMYAHSVKYDISTDKRVPDAADVDLGVGYVIHLPQGQGTCRFIPVNLTAGWGACQVARQVWKIREQRNYFLTDDEVPTGLTLLDMAKRAGSVLECQVLWKNGMDQGRLTDQVKAALTERAAELGAKVKGKSA